MNKAFYISSLALSFIFLFVTAYYIQEVESARYASFSDSIYSYSSGYSSYNYNSGSSETEEGGLVALLFLLFFITTDILGLVRIKRTTTKVLSIIGISIGGIFILWDVLMISSPSSISFDEVGAVFLLYSFVVIAFSIVGIIQSTRFSRTGNSSKTVVSTDLLDS